MEKDNIEERINKSFSSKSLKIGAPLSILLGGASIPNKANLKQYIDNLPYLNHYIYADFNNIVVASTCAIVGMIISYSILTRYKILNN